MSRKKDVLVSSRSDDRKISMTAYGLPNVVLQTRNMGRVFEFQNRNTHLWQVSIPFIAGGSVITTPFKDRKTAIEARNYFNGLEKG
jgi:hypothetical protein